MKVTKKLLLEIIESELSLLTEANEKEALRGYFSLGTDVELKIKDSGRIVTALQDYLISKKNTLIPEDITEVEEVPEELKDIFTAVNNMGDPDGNIGPKTVAAIKAFQGHIGEDETGIYNSAVHNAIDQMRGEESPEEESAKESAEETADFPHPKWDALLEELDEDEESVLKELSSEEAKTLILDIKKTFRSKLIDFVKGFRLSTERGNKSLHIEMKRAIRNKFVGRAPTDDPSWVSIDNIEEFNSLVDEQQDDKIFDEDSGTTASRYGGEDNEEDGTTTVLKTTFKNFIENTDEEEAPSASANFLNFSGVIKLKSLYNGVNEIIEKWDIVNPPKDPEDEPADGDEDIDEPLTESRFRKLAGI